ncbi:MAG: sulfatase, partial [Myxococcota bacterium]
ATSVPRTSRRYSPVTLSTARGSRAWSDLEPKLKGPSEEQQGRPACFALEAQLRFALGERLDRTLLVFTGDHGEALGEHGYTGHANHLSEEILQVPFFIRWPEKVAAGKVVTERGTTMDVTPTILQALGLPEAAGADGVSVLGPPRPAPPLFLMTDNPGGRQIRGVLSGGRKLLLSSEQGFGASGWADAEREYYDLARDPGEADNLAGGINRDLSDLQAATAAYFESGAVAKQRIDAATRRALKALGYVQ